jgi:hypothetical protein
MVQKVMGMLDSEKKVECNLMVKNLKLQKVIKECTIKTD